MVARDGIEPPTPAFSGPRSTTELSGLGTQAKRLIRGSPRTPGRTSVASSFSGELITGGSQQPKRNLSIATHGCSLQPPLPALSFLLRHLNSKDAFMPRPAQRF